MKTTEPKIKILFGKDPIDTTVLYDGHAVTGITKLSFSMSALEVPRVTLEIASGYLLDEMKPGEVMAAEVVVKES